MTFTRPFGLRLPVSDLDVLRLAQTIEASPLFNPLLWPFTCVTVRANSYSSVIRLLPISLFLSSSKEPTRSPERQFWQKSISACEACYPKPIVFFHVVSTLLFSLLRIVQCVPHFVSHFWNSSILFFVARAILARSLSLRVSVRHFLGHLFLWIPWPVFVDMSNSCFLLGRSSIDSGSQCIYMGTLFTAFSYM